MFRTSDIKCKATFVALLLFPLINIHAQNIPPQLPLLQNKIVYYDTININTLRDKAEVYKKARGWYVHNYQTSDNRLTIDNSDAGLISGSGTLNFREHKSDKKDLLFTIDIVVNKKYFVYKIYNLYGYDNGLKYEYSDVNNEELYPIAKPRWGKEEREYKLYNMDKTVQYIIQSLTATLRQ